MVTFMNEFELIKQLTRNLPTNPLVKVGPGDDCAVLDIGLNEEQLLFKTDAVVEGIHFTKDTPGEKVGHKALARCLSDVAAMGGKPTAALVTLGLPPNYDPTYVEKVYDGINALAERWQVAIAGGETTTNPGQILISIALIGLVSRKRTVLRSGSKAGDALFVTGELGGSLAGRHLEFEPRLAEGQWLAEHFPVHAMIDISDGLAGDLRHLMHAAGLGAEVLSRAVPISAAAKRQVRSESSAKPPLLAALTDGEDFELLFTIPSKQAVPLLDAWKKQFPKLKLSCIGRMTAEPGLKIRDKEGVRELNVSGYAHFS
jgi:thiamine-monophosphate kinase